MIVGLALLGFAFPRASDAHRLDEYLQATRISIELDRIEVEMNLTPGAAVADAVFAAIDVDHNGAISPVEGNAYAKLVIRSLSLSVDGHQRALTVDGCTLPPLTDMRNGVGIIRLRASAKTPRTAAGQHSLAFANRHRSDIGVYLINALIPADERIRITAQSRDTLQNEFKMEFKVYER
jgi:hypothetical protein